MPSKIEPGVQLSGHLLSEEIGAGGFSRVFRAQAADGSAVAIKVAVRPELVAALRAEGEVLRRLRGPRFVEILEEHLDADPPFVVLELCPGGDLRALLDRQDGGRLPPDRVLALADAILEGVAFAHEEGLVHGDLKPENVLLDAQGQPKIADLGLSRAHRRQLLDREQEVAASLATKEEKVRGTFDYLAPEVRKGGVVTPESDVFALGVLIYELLVGARPLGRFQLPGEVLAKAGVVVPRALDRIVARALAHEPKERHPDATVMLADLRAGDEGIVLTVRDAPEPATQRTARMLEALLERERRLDEESVVLLFGIPVALIPAAMAFRLGHPLGALEWIGVVSAVAVAAMGVLRLWHRTVEDA